MLEEPVQKRLRITHIREHFWVRRSPVWALTRVPGHPIRRRVGLPGPRYRRIWLNQILAHPIRFPAGFLINLLGFWVVWQVRVI